jgi:hypothetical protein
MLDERRTAEEFAGPAKKLVLAATTGDIHPTLAIGALFAVDFLD